MQVGIFGNGLTESSISYLRQILDEYGNIIDLNNMDFSFSLEISQKYNSY